MRINPIAPSRVRYIKLGEAGRYEKKCVEDRVNRIGFSTGESKIFRLCNAGRWDDLREAFIARGGHKGAATRAANEVKVFFEDRGDVLWITFIGERLYWGFISGESRAIRTDTNGVSRPIREGWRYSDLLGESLTKDRLSGALTKLTMYRGTSCEVKDDVRDYVIRRINGVKSPEVERAITASRAMQSSALDLMRLLEPRDFETLVDLIFSTSGWRRLGPVGGVEKTRDLDIYLPSTSERAFVQVKSRTDQAELDSYISRMSDGTYDKMFYVYHSGTVSSPADDRVRIIGPERLAEMVVEAGLVNWLIHKTGY